MAQVFAHTSSSLPDFLSWSVDQPWRFPWLWDPTLIFFAALSLAYGYSLTRFKKPSVRWWQVGLFYIGIVMNITALSPTVDDLAGQLFFVHMIQHMTIILLGTPFIIFGAPFFVISRALPPACRRRVYWPLIKNMVVRHVHALWSVPLISLLLFHTNFWFWHIPRWYDLALFNDFYHILEHMMMALTAIYFWRHIIDPHPLRSSLAMGVRILYLGSFMVLNIILAAMLTYADELWYAYERINAPSWWSSQWTRLDDQRLGGLLMWVPGGILLFVAMSVCFIVWTHREGQGGHGRPRGQKGFFEKIPRGTTQGVVKSNAEPAGGAV